jgi:hypothetical protein
MSLGSPARYEFTGEQNELIGDLARKMRLVGLVGVVVGVLNILSALLLLVFIFQDRLPADVLQRIPEDVRSKVPSTGHLWGALIQGVTAGLILLLVGVWTRAAGASFQQIVDTTGRDIGHLMNGLGELRKMYTLMYTLILICVVVTVVGLLLLLFGRFTGG